MRPAKSVMQGLRSSILSDAFRTDSKAQAFLNGKVFSKPAD
jgi:hypothetical protein